MANVGSSMGETSHASNSEAFEGNGPAPYLSRRDTVSSTGSDGYVPMPPGKWLVNFHGNCPKCHHFHTAVEVKVKVAADASKTTRVACEKCKRHWLILGSANSTQISLISTATTQPDPVENEVRLALVSMIKSATTFSAIASPTLAHIPESSPSGEPSTTAGFMPTPESLASATPRRITSPTAASSNQNEVPTAPLGTPSPGSTENVRNASRSRYFIRLKLKVTTRFPAIQKLKLGKLLRISNSKKPLPSAKSLGKMPANSSLLADPPAQEPPAADPIIARAVGSTAHEEQLGHHAVEPNGRGPQASGPSYQNPEAAHFIETLKNEPLDLMERKEQISWMRQKYTQFKAHRANSTLSNGTSMVDSRTQVSTAELLSVSHSQPERRLGFIGLGSHGGLMDRFRLDRFLPNHATSSAEEASSATAVDDSSTAPNQVLSGFLSRHGSPSPRSVNSQTLARQQPRHRGEARLSFDSTATGAASANRGRLNRRSRGSVGVTSQLGHNGMSQTSLVHRREEGNTNNEQENSPSPPPAPPSDNRRASP